MDATLAKIDYSIKEIQALQNIQKLEREIERALDMHGIRDSSLALLRGFRLRYSMKTQKVKKLKKTGCISMIQYISIN